MAELSDRLENVLNEARMLLLGGQVLLGFTYRICFEPAFDSMARSVHLVEVTALGIMTAGLGWLITPAAYHRIAEHGCQTERVHAFTTAVLDWGLLPFCVGLGLSFYPVAIALRLPHAAIIALLVFLLSAGSWYGAGLLRPRSERQRQVRVKLSDGENEKSGESDLEQRIKKVLIECRMALPGAQAFLGFQFAIVFTESFEKLPRSSRLIHFGALVSTTLAIVLLIAPAAYHRLAEAGQDTERVHTTASRLLLAALVFLAPGMAGDLYVVLAKVVGSRTVAVAMAGGLLAAVYALWFLLSWVKRR